jgi:membrane dipeptidase
MMLVVDGHEDIAYNTVIWGRDYTRSALATRQVESDAGPAAGRWTCTLGMDDWLAGNVAVIFATLFAQPARPNSPSRSLVYHTPQEAHKQAMQQLDIYHRLADAHPRFRLVQTARDLDDVLSTWQPEVEVEAKAKVEAEVKDSRQIGLVALMEGADPIVEPEQVEMWYERGLRMVGLSWVATRYAGGTHEPGPLTDQGHRLLRMMRQFNMALDLSHCAEQAFFQALDVYDGPILASHSNPRRFVNKDRHLSDDMIRRMVERDGIMGILPVNVMLKQGWQRGSRKDAVTLADVVAAIDYVCQLAGDAHHTAIGTDFDGGFGVEDIPAEFDTIADVVKIADALLAHGYAQADVEAIMSGNWLRLLRRILP